MTLLQSIATRFDLRLHFKGSSGGERTQPMMKPLDWKVLDCAPDQTGGGMTIVTPPRAEA